jgi:hypothetical protein
MRSLKETVYCVKQLRVERHEGTNISEEVMAVKQLKIS